MSNDFAKVMRHPRYGQILAFKVPYKPVIELHTEISGVRVIVGIDLSKHTSGKPFRTMLELWDKLDCDGAALLIDEYRENSPELQEELEKAHGARMSPEAADFVWKPTLDDKDNESD